MSEWGGEDPGRAGVGRHRAAPTQRLGGRLLAPVAAVSAVAVAVVVLIVLRGHSPGTGPGPGVIVAPTTTPAATISTTSTPSVMVTHPPPTPSESATRHHPPAARTAMAPVRVYNTTRITGLAHGVASQIAAKGWTVPVVGNIRATLAATTLYFSPKDHDAARHLARQFSGIQRIRPNRAAQCDYHGLTLVLTADWHS